MRGRNILSLASCPFTLFETAGVCIQAGRRASGYRKRSLTSVEYTHHWRGGSGVICSFSALSCLPCFADSDMM